MPSLEVLEDNRGLVRAIVVSLWVYCGFVIITLLLNAYLIYLYSSDFQYNLFEYIAIEDSHYILFAILNFLSLLAFGIMYIVYFKRVYSNARYIGNEELDLSEGMVVGMWFIPLYNLVKPYLASKQVYQILKEHLSKKNIIQEDKYKVSIVAFWWFGWVLTNILSRIPNRDYDSEIPEVFVQGASIELVFSSLEIIALVIAFKYIKELVELDSLNYKYYQERALYGDFSEETIFEDDDV
ncbi:MAG: hypothetical protein Kapaf2KO_16850 [Candidatus Kapaibacteriales bacterium]